MSIVSHPMVRGMISYAVLWPTGCAIQQLMEGRTLENFGYKRCLRFSIHGSLVVAPTLYGWLRFSSAIWPKPGLRTALQKVAVEQISYGPVAGTLFYINMNLLEFKTVDDGIAELKEKFWPTYKVGLCVWPLLQVVNFTLVPERNRVIYISIASVLWTTFLAYMKQLDQEKQLLNS